MQKEFLDRSAFTDKNSAIDLYSNSLRKSFEFDVYGNKTTFNAVVLTKPIFLADADLSSPPPIFASSRPKTNKLSKFAFKARILTAEVPTPHQFLPNPCNPTFTNKVNAKYINQVINLHTTFISTDDYTKGESYVPKTGDVVKVELTKNLFSYNLQFGKFIAVIDNRNGVGIPSTNPNPAAEESIDSECATAALFAAGAGFGTGGAAIAANDTEARKLAKEFLKKLRDSLLTGANATYTAREAAVSAANGLNADGDWEISTGAATILQSYAPPVLAATGTDSTGLSYGLSVCGTKSSKAWKSLYPRQKCVRCKVGGGDSLLHPDFCESIKKVHDAAIAHMSATYPDAPKTMEINNAGRTTETQIYLRIINQCGDDYNGIMTNSSSKCKIVQAAPPMSSRHEMGLAVDFGGVLTNRGDGGTKAAKLDGSSARNSLLYKWMRKTIHGKATFKYNEGCVDCTETITVGSAGASISNYDREPWHWSFDGH